MGTKRKLEPPPDPAPSAAIDHLFDGDADPARPPADRPPDVALDLSSAADEDDERTRRSSPKGRDVASGRTGD